MELPYPNCKPECVFIRSGRCAYSQLHVPVVAVDVDRVIFDHDHWQGHEHFGEPIPGVRDALLELQRMGFKIMIWTTRGHTDLILQALLINEIPFDFINENPNQPPEINPGKPVADYYIDDRAVHFTSWAEVIEDIKHREVHAPFYRKSGIETIYEGNVDQNAMNTIKCAIICYEGKRIKISIEEMKS